jgi:septal ring factor EnvC (AmiA/AmiB activator)
MKLIPSIISVITLISLCFGGYFWLDSHYASAQQVKSIEIRLESKVKSDQIKEIRSRIWQLQDRCKRQCDITTQEEIRRLEADLNDITDQLRVLERK